METLEIKKKSLQIETKMNIVVFLWPKKNKSVETSTFGQDFKFFHEEVYVYTWETLTLQFQKQACNKKFLFQNKGTHKRHPEKKNSALKFTSY